ncbi:MAG: transglycosylase SLT domain-containing protein [Dysgonamonadaceae bacterium]|nr:transglycosylase SLT domain-containing protein [Dysgonamonadaceae bacterium]MDD3495585.1 transglycosylase SLT domain-containing protein [Dysgonamonadaceae bacterium]
MKKKQMHAFLKHSAMVLLAAISISCQGDRKKAPEYDFPQIMERDTLRVLTLNTSLSYFIYRDQPMGYHYEMIKDFCDKHNLIPEVVLAHNSEVLVNMLNNNKGDVVAYDVPVDNSLKDSLIYCGLSQVSHQVLVQRSEKGDTLLKDVTQLIGKEVYVQAGTKYYDRLVNLNEELGGGIVIKDVDKDTVVVEDLIRMVANREIDYTIADEHVARLNKTYFRNIDVSMAVSFDQRSSWAVRKNMPVLADSLNSWFARINVEPTYRRITKRYFEEAKRLADGGLSSFPVFLKPGQISSFDNYFKKYGREFGIDWRLLASIAYHESSFDPQSRAWTGAGGIMGLMPATAAIFGVRGNSLFDPEINIKAGTEYLKKLLVSFSSIVDVQERTKMALAAYNGGIGHVLDARALAEKYGADKDVWDGNVEKYLQLKRLERYYEDPVCKMGYFRGDETIDYVRCVMNLWGIYKEKVKG